MLISQYKNLLPFLIFLLPIYHLPAQNLASDSVEVHFSQWFDAVVGLENTPLMNGDLYSMEPKSRTSHQFFKSKYFSPGTIKTSNQLYVNLMLLFDVETNLLILKHPDSTRWDGIKINMDEVEAFTMYDHIFQKIPDDGADIFFEMCFRGDSVSLLTLWKKTRTAEAGGIIFKESETYFLLHNEKLHSLNKMRSLKKIFPEHYEALKRIRREEKIRFSKNDAGRILLIQHLDNLLAL